MIQFLNDYKEASVLHNDTIYDNKQAFMFHNYWKFEIFHISKNNGIELIKRICENFVCEVNIIMKENKIISDVIINFQSGIIFTIGLNSLINIEITDSLGMKKIIKYDNDDQSFDEIKVFIKRYNKLSK